MSEENPIDTVNLEIPLLIRLFEYSREDATSDQDLHVVAENLVKLSKEGPLGMSVYDKVVPKKEEPKTETTVAGDVAGKDVSLFQSKDKIAKIKSVAEAVTAVLEKNLSGDISDKLKNAENLDPKKLQNLAAKYDLDISMEVRGREVEFTIDGSVGGHEDLNHLGSLLRNLVRGRNFSYNYGLKKSKVQVVF